MPLIIFIALAIVAGVAVPVQAAVNARLGKAVGDPLYGTFISFLVGAAGMFLYLVVNRIDFTQIQQLRGEHWSTWVGGLLGAFFVASLIILTPRLGIALTLGLTIAGQMVFALIMDHYGWLGTPVIAITWPRVLGVVLIIAGVWLVQKF